jgi:hypothetical protein
VEFVQYSLCDEAMLNMSKVEQMYYAGYVEHELTQYMPIDVVCHYHLAARNP